MTGVLPGENGPRANATDFLIASKQCEILSLESFLRMGKLVVAISNLVHGLQRERGGSNLYLGSAGQRYGERLTAMTADTDQQVLRFQKALAELNTGSCATPGDSRLFSRIAYALHALSEISVLRARVRDQVLTPASATSVYSELIRSLLAVVFEAADTAMDPTISRVLVAMFNFMQGKELAGQERAVGAAGFARGRFDAGLVERMQHLAEAQERCFEIFSEFADRPVSAAWDLIRKSPDLGELERLRRLAGNAEAHERQAPGTDRNLSERWFWLATARIDAMKSVEDRLEIRLHELCEEKLGEAREGLTKQRTLIESLVRKESEPDDSFIVFCSAATAAGHQDSYRSDGISPRLGRSIIDLVQSQSQRLQAMSEELSTARAALEERKVLDQAKRLLIKHRNMTEEEAYRLLRQTAMNQSRRLVEVARAMIAVADVWTRPGEGQR